MFIYEKKIIGALIAIINLESNQSNFYFLIYYEW